MRKLDKSPEIVEMATALGLTDHDPVRAIISYCRDKVTLWCRDASGVKNIKQVEELVCRHLKLVIEEFSDIDGLKRIIRKYVSQGEGVFATLIDEFDDKTFATLLERRNINGRSTDRYVAIIDCRGQKAHRRFFSRWHEIAHLLTLYNQLQLPFHRSTVQGDPVERMMDLIAGEVGFFDPFIQPLIEQELGADGFLSLSAVERIRQAFCAEASFASTLKACAARLHKPIIYLEAGFGLKKCETELDACGMFDLPDFPKPSPKVRALVVVPNTAAHGKIEIHKNMAIPDSSIISRVLRGEGDFSFLSSGLAVENLGDWSHSDGSRLPACSVRIECRRFGERLIALLQSHVDK